jgi:hypothetical protein
MMLTSPFSRTIVSLAGEVMGDTIDGTYSVTAAGSAGCSLAVCSVQNGHLIGNDIGGARYAGSITETGEQIVLDIQMTFPPGTFGIWGSSPAETWETRSLRRSVSNAEWQSGNPIYVAGNATWVTFRRIPDDYAHVARPGGHGAIGARLQAVEAQWQARGKP